MSSLTELELNAGSAPSGASLFLNADTHVRVTAWEADVGTTLVITSLLWHPVLGLQKSRETLTPTPDRVASVKAIPMGIGWLVSLQVAGDGVAKRGQCYVRVELTNGFAATGESLATIIQGNLGTKSALSYPGGPQASALDGPGNLRFVTIANPAPGAEFTQTVPTDARWKILAIGFTFTASVAVANRSFTVLFRKSGVTLYEVGTGIVITASQAPRYRLAAGVPFLTVDTLAYTLPLPTDFFLTGLSQILSITANIQAGDDYTAPLLLVEEWIDD
jgi:hypothetical protein